VDGKPVENSTEVLTLILSNQTRLSATVKEDLPLWIFITFIILGIVAFTIHVLHWRIVLFREKRLLRK
jgi:hypothetical protein